MKTITVRLEGGIGDHLLGMRLLRYIHVCYPEYRIVAYSDAGGSVLPLEVAALSPYVSEVRSLEKDPMRVSGSSAGSLAQLTAESLTNLQSGEHFFDAHTELLFLEECRRLNIPYFEVLASRPQLAIPADAVAEARALLSCLPCTRYVAVNFTKYGPSAVRRYLALIDVFLSQILQDPELGVLHFCMTSGDPRHDRSSQNYQRRPGAPEAAGLDSLAECYPGRVFPVMDRHIVNLCALLQECSYFVGVGNDLKYLAWALDVPCTWLGPKLWPDAVFRWAPDYNCMLELKPFSNMEEMGRLLASRVKDALHRRAAMPQGESDPYAAVTAN